MEVQPPAYNNLINVASSANGGQCKSQSKVFLKDYESYGCANALDDKFNSGSCYGRDESGKTWKTHNYYNLGVSVTIMFDRVHDIRKIRLLQKCDYKSLIKSVDIQYCNDTKVYKVNFCPTGGG